MTEKAKRSKARMTAARSKRYREFVELFYEVHYRLGMTLESAMCNNDVSRTQASIMWLLATEIGPSGEIARKDIEHRLRGWYETSNSNISKLLRDLAKPPLEFIIQKESPHSGREKIVSLTPKGVDFVKEMKLRGFSYMEAALSHVAEEELACGTRFFRAIFSRPLPEASEAAEQAQRPRRTGSPRRNQKSGWP